MFEVIINKNKYSIKTDEKNTLFEVNGTSFNTKIADLTGGAYSVSSAEKNTKLYLLNAVFSEKKLTILINGKTYIARVKDNHDILLEKMGMSIKKSGVVKELRAPMPGLVLDVLVKEGQTVSKNSSLLILEAMKMENVLKNNVSVCIKKILIKKGGEVEKNQPLILFK